MTKSRGILTRRYPAGHLLNCRGYLYRIWVHMIDRCHRSTDAAFKNYGARGICVCEKWRSDFEAFARDMGPRPTDLHTLDRVDNDGPYAPWNCRWATRREQARNKRGSLYVNGVPLAEAAESAGLGYRRVYSRVRRGRTDHALDPSHLHRLSVCRKGHPREGENLYVSPDGRRHCRACARIYSQRMNEQKRRQL